MIKNPALGTAKTRLAATVGDQEALRIYHLLLAHTRKVAIEANIDTYLYYSDRIEDDEWPAAYFTKRIQADGDLGNRMRSAFAEVSQYHNKIIIIGSDCAQLTSEHIRQAIISLNNYDVVMGPVHDGGYYLLGTKGHHPAIMTDISWSTSSVVDQTIQKTKENNLSYTTIETLSDIDYYDDWIKYGQKILDSQESR